MYMDRIVLHVDVNNAKEMEKDHDMIEFAHEELERTTSR